MFFSQTFLIVSLVLILLVSALAVIASKHQSRTLFIDIQKQERVLDKYEIKWGQLQLELMTLTEENRVANYAKEQLDLVMPERKNIIYLKP
jgi:cell division protein FtsL